MFTSLLLPVSPFRGKTCVGQLAAGQRFEVLLPRLTSVHQYSALNKEEEHHTCGVEQSQRGLGIWAHKEMSSKHAPDLNQSTRTDDQQSQEQIDKLKAKKHDYVKERKPEEAPNLNQKPRTDDHESKENIAKLKGTDTNFVKM